MNGYHLRKLLDEDNLRKLFDTPNLVYLENKNESLFLEDRRMVLAENVGEFGYADEDYPEFYDFIKKNRNSHPDKFISMVLRYIYPSLVFDAFTLKPNYGFNIDGRTRHHGNLYKILEIENGMH